MRERLLPKASILSITTLLLAAACGASGDDAPDDKGNKADNIDGNGKGNGDPKDGDFGSDSDSGTGGGVSEGRDPVDCAEAASSRSYVGCDYWPTVTPNTVASDFRFVVAVANTGKGNASVKVTGPNGFSTEVSVAADSLQKIELPWVTELKGADGNGEKIPKATILPNGAYHLVSSSPVIVYQFNPYEYETSGKNSYTNDASLLLPSTAMTGNYRVAGHNAWQGGVIIPILNIPISSITQPSVLSITATAANTHVKLRLAPKATIVQAGSIAAANGGSLVEFDLPNAGDVAQLLTPGKSADEDFSGSVIEASAPVQVITSLSCLNVPANVPACDHVEETVLPAEALGKKYVIAPPTGFNAQVAKQVVRIYGNKDGTTLTYQPSKPSGCPDTLSAGQVADCGIVEGAFVVEGNNEFNVMSYLLGASYYTASNPQSMGDPSQTSHPAVEQFRKNYIFLAPPTYPVLWADVTAPQGTTLTLDGNPVTANWEQIGNTNYGVFRLDLTKSGQDGAHKLESSQPVGVQVLGYGSFTTFQYPAGLNLNLIAAPPTVN